MTTIAEREARQQAERTGRVQETVDQWPGFSCARYSTTAAASSGDTRRFVNLDHLVDLALPLGAAELRLGQHHAGRVTGQAIAVDRVRVRAGRVRAVAGRQGEGDAGQRDAIRRGGLRRRHFGSRSVDGGARFGHLPAPALFGRADGRQGDASRYDEAERDGSERDLHSRLLQATARSSASTPLRMKPFGFQGCSIG